MRQKLSIRNIAIAASFLIAVSLLVLFDYHRVHKDFRRLQTDLMRIRFRSITENKPIVVKFNGNEVSVLAFPDGPLLETLQFSTISNGKLRYHSREKHDRLPCRHHKHAQQTYPRRRNCPEILVRVFQAYSRELCRACSGREVPRKLMPATKNL